MLNRGSLKDGRQRKFLPSCFLDEGEQTHRQQRVSSQLKKIISHPDRSNAQNLSQMCASWSSRSSRGATKAFSNSGLDRSGAGSARRPPFRWASPQGSSSTTTAAPCTRQRVFEKATQLIGCGVCDHIGHQPASLSWAKPKGLRRVFSSQDDGLPHGPGVGQARPQFPPVRCENRGSSLGGRHDQETRYFHRADSGPGRGLVHSCPGVALRGRE